MDTSSQKLLSLSRRTAFQTAIVFSALVSLANCAIFLISWLFASHVLQDTLRTHVEEMRRTLVNVYEATGTTGLVGAVKRRMADDENDEDLFEGDEDIFLLTDKSGKKIIGNAKALEFFTDWRALPQNKIVFEPDFSPTSDAYVGRWTSLSNVNFFIADGTGRAQQISRSLGFGFFGGILASVICAFLGGLWLGRKAESRLASIRKVLDFVADGELHRRIQISLRPDDIDDVAGGVNSMLERMESVVGNLKQATSDIAHDLRSPITRLRHKIELMIRPGQEHANGGLHAALADVDELSNIFDAMLRITELESFSQRKFHQSVDLASVADNVVEALDAVASTHRHRLIYSPPPTPLFVRGDRKLLSQLLINLIENAMKYCPPGSIIELALTKDERGTTVVVSDNGPGVPDEEKQLVFRRLYRMDKSRSTPGHGLGLSLVKAIAEFHSGSVELHDNKPGLAVYVTFPSA